MKKTIALIISIILVVAIFASCTPATEDVAMTDEEADAIDIEESYDINNDETSEENLAAGFYIEGNPWRLLSVGSEVPKNCRVLHLDNDGNRDDFNVHDGNTMMNRLGWYDSGNTAYIVKRIDGNTLYLVKPDIVEGLYIVKADERKYEEREGTMLQVGMILYEHTEVAFLDKQQNKQAFKYEDGDGKSGRIGVGSTYNTGNSVWKVSEIKYTPKDKYKATLVMSKAGTK